MGAVRVLHHTAFTVTWTGNSSFGLMLEENSHPLADLIGVLLVSIKQKYIKTINPLKKSPSHQRICFCYT